MPKRCSLFKSSYWRRKIGEKPKTNKRKPRRIIWAKILVFFTVFSLLLSICGPVVVNCFLPEPPQDIVVEETCISTSLTTPASAFFINVTEYNAQQIVKNITAELSEPISYVSFTLNVLGDKPAYMSALSNATVLQYYTIRFLPESTDKIANFTMFFAIEKAPAQEKGEEVTLMLYRYNRGKIEECPTEKVGEDDTFSYFETKTEGSSYIVVTGAIMPAPWWIALIVLIVVLSMVAIITIVYRRFKLAKLRKLEKL